MRVHHTPIEGLLIIDLDVRGDNRGWFKENWQREKMLAAGLPDFRPVQSNVSFNAKRGVTRGLHAEPWDKLVSVATGRVHGAWCDLREGSPTYGQTHEVEINPATGVFVPRGVANGFQALEDATTYIYLVNDHWSPQGNYANVNLNLIKWPLEPTEISGKDRSHPSLIDASPLPPRRVLVTGADGQVGRALRRVLPNAQFCTREELDITNPPERPWRQYSAIINAAAYTDVDRAETDRARAWQVNAEGPMKLARIAADNNLTLVHLSSDYVFDGETTRPYLETDPLSPLGVYGQSKAAGDLAVATCPRHYIVRTGWVVGEGTNFVDTMAQLAAKGVEPHVVNDQRGRPTFTDDLAHGIAHLLATTPAYGTYNLSNSGDEIAWDELARETFALLGHDPGAVHPVSTTQYFEGRPHAPRPSISTLDLTKIEATGFAPRPWRDGLARYLS
ncbi:dTDP-4-dehydrorhamnose reductase [Corynebacterium testudinoris]|uniref:dTDP-4-dehydrorhamnose reductase n=1 Tax=Corynebacterium testudinoris TaxID=136857 RepID=A0A0G3H4T8_9CORY|nr:dTDP-4-dehydrorhamnose reductase [Corynebacterium testudinoris]AKK07740.1 dTDP-4-dehydrorhamnose reductase [Corynebacterium testudinoris]MBX8995850.1 dTDP-4-dehydrorhamnose reductase [Corynebacterium testudinoris]